MEHSIAFIFGGLLLPWIITEFIFRRQPLAKRMAIAATVSIAFVVLAQLAYLSGQGQSWASPTISSLIENTIVAGLVYGIRLALAKGWSLVFKPKT